MSIILIIINYLLAILFGCLISTSVWLRKIRKSHDKTYKLLEEITVLRKTGKENDQIKSKLDLVEGRMQIVSELLD